MVKHTQTIRWRFIDKLFEYVLPFCEIGAYRVNNENKTFRSELEDW